MHPEDPPTAAPPPGDAAYRLIGHGFIILAVATLVIGPLDLVFERRPRFDFGFILYGWIGGALLQRGLWSRRIVLVICASGLGASVWILIESLTGSAAGATALGGRNPAPDLAALSCGLACAIFLPPLILLLRPEARRLAGVPPEARPPRRFALLYVVGILTIVSGAYSFDRLLRKETIHSSSTFIPRWDVTLVKAWAADGGAPPKADLLLWVANLRQGEVSTSDRRVRVGGLTYELPEGRSWVLIRPPPRTSPNVVVIAPDGREIRVPRRMTVNDVAGVEAALDGFTDLADLERRLLSALPE